MKLPKEILIEKVASTDASRSAIGEPYLDVTDGKGTLVSTNGNAMAIVPVALAPEDVAGYVSKAVLKAARKQAGRLRETIIGLNGFAALADGSAMPRNGAAQHCTFPSWRQVVPKEISETTITLDARLLWELAQSMGTRGVRLCVVASDKPVIVLPAASGNYYDRHVPACAEARGVIMPIAEDKKD